MSVFAQTPAPKPTLEGSLAKASYALSIEGGRMTGPGATILQTAISQADYVLLGEDHLTREIPRFGAAVCDAMASGGLSAMAFEASPAVARFVQESLKTSNRIQTMAELQKKYPDSAAFLNIKDENDLAAHCAAISTRSNFEIWGLDQEFMGSAGWILARMLAANPGPAARGAILHLQALERADVEEARKTGDPSKLFLVSVPDSDIQGASAAINKDGTPATKVGFHELTTSRTIYLEQGTHPSDSNASRGLLMKHNFLTYYNMAGGDNQSKRILFKFGDWHLYKGVNPLHQRDLGNFIAEFADGQGKGSLHILVLGIKGTHAVYSGYDRPLKFEPFDMVQDDDYKWLKPAIDAKKAESWTLFDLRGLRFRQLNLDADWQRVVYGYDLLVLIPELTPAALIQ